MLDCFKQFPALWQYRQVAVKTVMCLERRPDTICAVFKFVLPRVKVEDSLCVVIEVGEHAIAV
jgi:hypothetical protein